MGEPADVLFAHACQLERELAALQAKYAAECDASMMAGSQNSALRLQLKDSTAQTKRLRDDIIEQCAAVADREWVGENSLIGSRVSRKIADAIRDLKVQVHTATETAGK